MPRPEPGVLPGGRPTAVGSPTSMDSAVVFYPRGGSAQVIRYLLRELNSRGWQTRLATGTLGAAGTPSHAATFYQGLDLRPFDYNAAQAAFEDGADAQAVPLPFHPSYEDHGDSADVMFSAVSPRAAAHLTRAWYEHLAAHRNPAAKLLHLHHLSHLQHAARQAYPAVPTVTTLHGTELKLIEGMSRRIRLAGRAGLSLAGLAHDLAHDSPGRLAAADRLAARTRLDEDERSLLVDTRWEHWQHSRFWLRTLRAALAHAGTIVTVSEHDRDRASQLLPLRDRGISVIANGVDTHQFRPQILSDDERLSHLRRWLVDDPRGWRPGGPVGSIRYSDADLRRLFDARGQVRPILLWVGRFLHFKRVPVLLEAFRRASSHLDPAPVLLMWGGYPSEYEGVHPADLVSSLDLDQDVFFLGWRGHDELPLGLNCADLMVAPAVNEPFGMVYVEAMACGTPPIATATGGPARIITSAGPNATGWTVRPDDVIDLAAVLVEASSNRAERDRRGRNGSAHARATYDWAAVADRYTVIYDRALG